MITRNPVTDRQVNKWTYNYYFRGGALPELRFTEPSAVRRRDKPRE